MTKPTIGRIVHFYDHSRPRDATGKPGPHAAIVTATDGGIYCNLTVFPDGYPPVAVQGIPEGDEFSLSAMRWTWPPRE